VHVAFAKRIKSRAPKGAKPKPIASKAQGELEVGWFLSTTDKWTAPYYDPNDLRSVDRQLFAERAPTKGVHCAAHSHRSAPTHRSSRPVRPDIVFLVAHDYRRR